MMDFRFEFLKFIACPYNVRPMSLSAVVAQ
jgi:hypothetical protein